MNDITSITSEQLKAAAAWTVEGETMATIDLTVDLTREGGVLIVTQGDDQAVFNRYGIEVGDRVS